MLGYSKVNLIETSMNLYGPYLMFMRRHSDTVQYKHTSLR